MPDKWERCWPSWRRRSDRAAETEKALKVLDEEKLRGLVASARERKAEAEKEIEEATQAWLLKARLLTPQFQFAEADKVYRAAVKASPENFSANLAFANFNQDLNRYQEARKVYERCLELARKSGKEDDIGVTLNNLAVLDRDQNRMEVARMECEEALKIYRELAQKNLETSLSDVAITLNNLAILDCDQNLFGQNIHPCIHGASRS